MRHDPLRPHSIILAAALLCATAAHAQIVPAGSHPYDLNVYPTLGSSGGLYDLNVAGPQANGPPGTIALTSATPPAAYSFADVLAHTHGYVEAGVSTRSGHEFSGGVSIPLVPGKADLDLALSTGQFAGLASGLTGKNGVVTYDSYSAGLHLHPTDDIDAYIGVSGLRLHGPAPYWYGYP